MQYWLSDVCLILAQWLGRCRPLNRAGRIGVYIMAMSIVVWMALACSTADSTNFWAAWWWSLEIAGIIAGIGALMALLGACLAAFELR